MLAYSAHDLLVVETRQPTLAILRNSFAAMEKKIIGFDQDSENGWRAKLVCGHYQHVRHNPPLVTREWVLSEAGRTAKIGAELECKKCNETTPRDFEELLPNS